MASYNRDYYFKFDTPAYENVHGCVHGPSDMQVQGLLEQIFLKKWNVSVAGFGRSVQLYQHNTLEGDDSNLVPLEPDNMLVSDAGNSLDNPLILRVGEAFVADRVGQKMGDGTCYASMDDLWTWEKVKPSDAVRNFRRIQAPHVYQDLVDGASQIHGLPFLKDAETANTTIVTDLKILNDVSIAITGSDFPCKGHSIPKSTTCRPFYGPVAEMCTGMNLNTEPMATRKKIWTALLWGGNTNGRNFKGVEKALENFLSVQAQHRSDYDVKPEMAAIPIVTTQFSREWQQGEAFDILLVVSKRGPFWRRIGTNSSTTVAKFHREALVEEVETATQFLRDCIMALSETLTDENMLLGPMRQFLSNPPSNLDEVTLTDLWSKLLTLEDVRAKLIDGVDVPRLNGNWDDVVALKVDMATYLELSGCGTLDNGEYPYPDPFLLGVKAAINAYYVHTGLKLLPTCSTLVDDDDDSGDGTATMDFARAFGGYSETPTESQPPEPPQESIDISENDDVASEISFDSNDGNWSPDGAIGLNVSNADCRR